MWRHDPSQLFLLAIRSTLTKFIKLYTKLNNNIHYKYLAKRYYVVQCCFVYKYLFSWEKSYIILYCIMIFKLC
jgi:hypothetical protein